MHYNFGMKRCEPFEVKIMNPETKVEIDLAAKIATDDFTNMSSFK